MSLEHSAVKTPFFTEPSDRGSAPSGLSQTLDPLVLGRASLRASESTARIYIPQADKEGRMEEASVVHACKPAFGSLKQDCEFEASLGLYSTSR